MTTPDANNPKPPEPPKRFGRLIGALIMLGSGAATIYGFFQNGRVAVLGIIGMVFGIVLVIVVQQAIRAASRKKARFYDVVAKILVAFVVACFILVVVLLFKTFVDWLKQEFTTDKRLSTPSPYPIGRENPESDEQTLATLTTTCKPETNRCTIFLFDYLNDQLSAGEFQWFQTMQADRLDKGIRNNLQSFGLLKEIDFRIVRCSDAVIRRQAVANRAITTLKVPAIMWGFVKRDSGKLLADTAITFADDQLIQFTLSDQPVNDVRQLVNNSIKGSPLAIASLIVGDIHLKKGDVDNAKRAFEYAKELLPDVDSADKNDFAKLVDKRLKSIETNNPAALLKPIASK